MNINILKGLSKPFKKMLDDETTYLAGKRVAQEIKDHKKAKEAKRIANLAKEAEGKAHQATKGKKEYLGKDPKFTQKSSGNNPNVPAVIQKAATLEDPAKETTRRSKIAAGLAGLGALATPGDKPETKETPKVKEVEPTQEDKEPIEEPQVQETEPVEPKITKPKKEEMGSIRKAQARYEKTLKAIGTPPDDPLMESEEGAVLSNTLKESNLALSKLSDPPMTGPEQRALAYKELKKARQSRVNTLEWAKVFEKLVAAVTKYGAAREGLDRGLDMSRAEIERTDWNAMINQAFDTYKLDLDEISTRFGKEDKAKEKVDSKRVEIKKLAEAVKEAKERRRYRDEQDKKNREFKDRELAQKRDLTERKLEQTKEIAEAKAENKTEENPMSDYKKIAALEPENFQKIMKQKGSITGIPQEILQSAIKDDRWFAAYRSGNPEAMDKALDMELLQKNIREYKTPQVPQSTPAPQTTNKPFRVVQGPDGEYRQYSDGTLEKLN